MWNPTKNTQDEKDQQKIEAILEEQHRAILDRSHLLVTTIFVILGAYAVILVAIYFPTSSFPTNNNSSALNQAPSWTSVLNKIPPWTSNVVLFLSIASIIIAFGYIWRSFTTNDRNFITKLEKKDSPIKVNVTPRNCIVCNIDEKDFSIHLKNGKELLDRNKQLYNVSTSLKISTPHFLTIHLPQTLHY